MWKKNKNVKKKKQGIGTAKVKKFLIFFKVRGI